MKRKLQISKKCCSFNIKSELITMIALFMPITMNAQNDDIYVAGEVGKLGKVWKNNVELYSVADETSSVSFDCIHVSGNDVYTGGTIGSITTNHKAVVWKNGELLHESPTENISSYVDAISVSNGDVYACGSYSTNAVVWKNGIMTTLGKGFYNSYSDFVYYYATAMQVIDNDVYVAGYTGNDRWYNSGRIWKNGTELFWIANAVFTDIAVSGSNIYISGYKNDGQLNKIATIWKNDIELYSESDFGHFSAISISGNDVYIAGYTTNSGSNKFAKVWKNGTVLYQLTDGTTDSRGIDICIKNDDVYVLTRTFASQNQNIVWKNGVKLYDMGSQSANAICFPSSSTTAIASIERQSLQIYPNPASDEITISGLQPNEIIWVYNLSGRLLLSRVAGGETENITISHLPTGMYIVRTSAGESVKWTKSVIY